MSGGSGWRPVRAPGNDPAYRRLAPAVALWCLLFGGIHVYWALGGRAGLGAESASADAALSSAWFGAYNAAVAVAALGWGVLVVLLRFWRATSPHATRIVRALALVGGVALLCRGVLGAVLLVPEVVDGTVLDHPWPLLLIEPAFVVGGLLLLAMRRVDRVDAAHDGAVPPDDLSSR